MKSLFITARKLNDNKNQQTHLASNNKISSEKLQTLNILCKDNMAKKMLNLCGYAGLAVEYSY